MANRLKDKAAVVTGSTSGIGAGIARAFAAEGAAVVISGRRAEEGEAMAAGIREEAGAAVYQETDLRNADDCKNLCQRAKDEFGGLDILVNNAGIFPRAKLEETSPEFWDAMLDINLKGAFLCCQSAAPLMRERGGGSIINIGSTCAFSSGGPGDSLFAYGCSKGAMYIMTMKLAGNLASDRIRVNWVTVGWVLTEKEFEIQAVEGNNPEWLEENEKRLPMNQYNTVEDMAAGCIYLASDEAERVTGSNLNIAAGMGIHI